LVKFFLKNDGTSRAGSSFLFYFSNPQPFVRAGSAEELRWAMASMEIMGLTPEAEGKDKPSMT
jgi:hypothetical protein